MFTGIIQEIAQITKVEKKANSMFFSIKVSKPENEIKIGDSVAINGVCQTVIKKENNILTFEAMFETLNSTNFADFKKNDFVNVEYAVKAGDSLGGHIVSGHIDTKGEILSIQKNEAYIFKIKSDVEYIIKKGSVSINGISLTVQNVYDDSFDVVILPYTFSNTNLQYLKEGAFVNLEFDMIAKYIKKFITPKEDKKSKITREFLIENGF